MTWNYSVADSAVEYLAAGQTKVETFTFTLIDGNGGTVDPHRSSSPSPAPTMRRWSRRTDVTGAVTEQVTAAPAT